MLHRLRDVQCYLLDRAIMPHCLRDVQSSLLDRNIMPHNRLFSGDTHCSLYDRTIVSITVFSLGTCIVPCTTEQS